jgi:hypothetical protein
VVRITTSREGNFDATARKVRSVHPHEVGDFPDLLQIGTDEDFVRECYRRILKREPDDDGANYYVGRLAERLMGREAVIDLMFNSDERKALAAKRPA